MKFDRGASHTSSPGQMDRKFSQCSHSLELKIPHPRNSHYSPHSHQGLTTHLILKGQLTITYPKEQNPEKKTYGVGDRIDVGAEVVHEVWVGSGGCTYVIGE